MTLDPSLVLGAGAAVMYAGWALFQKQAVVTLEGSEAPIFIFLFAVRTSNPPPHPPPSIRTLLPIPPHPTATALSGTHPISCRRCGRLGCPLTRSGGGGAARSRLAAAVHRPAFCAVRGAPPGPDRAPRMGWLTPRLLGSQTRQVAKPAAELTPRRIIASSHAESGGSFGLPYRSLHEPHTPARPCCRVGPSEHCVKTGALTRDLCKGVPPLRSAFFFMIMFGVPDTSHATFQRRWRIRAPLPRWHSRACTRRSWRSYPPPFSARSSSRTSWSGWRSHAHRPWHSPGADTPMRSAISG